MKNKLPVCIETWELPMKQDSNVRSYSYGYVSILYLASIIITITSVLVVLLLGK